MLNGQQIITEILQSLKEVPGLLAADPQPHWPRGEILQRCNLAQELIETELPGILNVTDTALTTTGSSGGYTIPATISSVKNVSLGGTPLGHTSRQALISRSVRGDISADIDGTAGTPTDWYVVDDEIYLYPYTTTAGTTITVEGTAILTAITDDILSYPMNSKAVLTKAQRLLILLVVLECAKEDDRTPLYQTVYNEVYNFENGLLPMLKTEWFILKTDPQESMLEVKREE